MDPIRIRDAAAHGLTPKILYGKHWVRPADGVALVASSANQLRDRCRAVLAVLPDDAVVTHLTAAALRGWWLPDVGQIPIIVCTGADAAHHDRRGVYVRRCGLPRAHRTSVGGVGIASAAWTIVELAEDLSLVDLVVVIDSALHAGHVTQAEIREAMVPRRRGVRVLRRALDLVDARSESAWETVLRLLHVISGIEVEPQVQVRNRLGEVVARGDLGIVGTNRLAEYDGADHRRRDQHERDLRREKLLARRGIERFGYIASEILRDPARVIRDAEDALGLRPDPKRVLPWLAAVAASTFSDGGAARLRRRLKRFDRRTSPRSPSSSGAS